jgi:solute carrier family 20 (sodium-dependent phosphate transporter)
MLTRGVGPVGGIIGAGIACYGPSAINWGYASGGVAQIVVSWVVSPVIAGVVAACLFLATKHAVLLRRQPFLWATRTIGLYFFATFAIISFFFVYKGSPALGLDKQPPAVVAGLCFGIALTAALVAQLLFVPWAVRTIQGRENIPAYLMPVVHCLPSPYYHRGKRPAAHDAAAAAAALPAGTASGDTLELATVATTPTNAKDTARLIGTATDDDDDDGHDDEQRMPTGKWEATTHETATAIAPVPAPTSTIAATPRRVLITPRAQHGRVRAAAVAAVNWVYGILSYGLSQDIRGYQADEHAAMHRAAAQYESTTEELYSFLQVSTASFASFAHGSNDVANAVGPLSAVFFVWQTGTVDITGQTPVPLWVLALGGVMIDVGLLLFGFHIMRSLGNRLTYHSPSRGFCMELGAMLTVLTASRLGLPISTTHCITGATAGVGLCNGDARAVNWRLMGWNLCSWMLTLPCAGLVAGCLFAFMAYSPSMPGYTGGGVGG